jgi:GNAT superfamily N-acetyltransferase
VPTAPAIPQRLARTAVTMEIVKLRESQIEMAGAMLARAFQNDPLMVYTLPRVADRVRLLPEYYTRMVRFGCLSGDAVYTTAGPLIGAAVWLPPGTQWTRARVEAAGLHELSGILGEDAMRRFREVVTREAQARERDMTPPYWYLLLLGVEPVHQGRGIGGALIKPILARAQREGLACYLESEQPRNVDFYLKQGFELIVNGEAAGTTGVRFWTFRRTPER